METPICLDDLDYLKLCHEDRLKVYIAKAKERGDFFRENARWLHGISYDGVFLKPRKYNRYAFDVIRDILSDDGGKAWATAVEVNTRIYVRDYDGKWYLVPKRRFWASQARMLWTAYRDVVCGALPWGKYDSWCHHLMNQIDSRRDSGEFKYNPLTTPSSRTALRKIYRDTVFKHGQALYDKEKGKPGRKPKKKSILKVWFNYVSCILSRFEIRRKFNHVNMIYFLQIWVILKNRTNMISDEN